MVRGCTFAHNLVALALKGDEALVENSRFRANSTSLRAEGSRGMLRGNHSLADGSFLMLDRTADRWLIEGNTIEQSLDIGIVMRGETRDHRVLDNQLLNGSSGIMVDGQAAGLTFERNRVRSCQQALVVIEGDLSVHELLDNQLTEDRSLCGAATVAGGSSRR